MNGDLSMIVKKALIAAAVLLFTARVVPALAHDEYRAPIRCLECPENWHDNYGWWRHHYRWPHHYGWRGYYGGWPYGGWRSGGSRYAGVPERWGAILPRLAPL